MLNAVLQRITYANEETGYRIARVTTDRSGSDLVTVVGALLWVQGGSLRLVGRWGSHKGQPAQHADEHQVDELEGHSERSCGAGLWTVAAGSPVAKALIRRHDTVPGTHRPRREIMLCGLLMLTARTAGANA